MSTKGTHKLLIDRSDRSEKGIAAIELALVLPLFTLLIIGLMDLAVMMYNTQVITNASREGARWGVIANNNPTHLPWACTTSSTTDASPCGVANKMASGLLISFKGSPITSTTGAGGGVAGGVAVGQAGEVGRAEPHGAAGGLDEAEQGVEQRALSAA